MTIEEAILESLRQWIETGQQLGRDGGTRRIRRPPGVHPQRQCHGHFLHGGERVADVARLQVPPDDGPELRNDRGREDVSMPRILARRANGRRELLLVLGDLFRRGVPRYCGHRSRELRSQRQVGARALAELTERACPGADVLGAGRVGGAAGGREGSQQERRQPGDRMRHRQHSAIIAQRRAVLRAPRAACSNARVGRTGGSTALARACAATSTPRDAAGGLA